MSLFDGTSPAPFPLREPCRWCGSEEGTIRDVNGQDTVRCASCRRFLYNAPRHETGKKVRSINERPDIKPSRRRQLLERDNHTCISCHRNDRPLTIGHLLSVKQGRQMDVPDDLLFSDENLAVMCEECNSGYSFNSVGARLMYQMIRLHSLQPDDFKDE